jgi:Zn-finger nucleic acid-binding protein
MKCPNDGELLVIAERQGIEIDYCPKCRGVWLDKGELDKIIERSSVMDPDKGSNSSPREKQPPYTEHHRSKPYYKDDDYYRHKKKKGFLGDLFDFD